MRPYTFIARDHHKPVVMAGFEPLDILQAIYMIVKQISEGRAEVENQYSRVVRPEGNVKGLDAMARTQEVRGACEILGLDPLTIANGGKLLAIVAADQAETALAAMRSHPLGREAAMIGTVQAEPEGMVFFAY